MQAHNLKKPKQKTKRRVGRGGKRGTYSGKGMKGQKSRAGANIRPQIWDYILKIPKLTGPTGKGEGKQSKLGPIGKIPGAPVFTVNTGDLQKAVKKGDTVDVEFLVKNNLVRRYRGRLPRRVKILAKGELKKQITVKGLMASSAAKEQIEKTGGKII